VAASEAQAAELLHQVITADVPGSARTLVLKNDDCFGVFDEIGDIDAESRGEAGLYRAGVRHLSRLTMTLGSARPLSLGTVVREDDLVCRSHLTNADLRVDGRIVLPRGTLHVTRSKFIWNGVCHELIRVRNFSLTTASVELVIRFAADFESILDLRAQRRVDAGRPRFERVEGDRVTLGGVGADEFMRELVVECHSPPDVINADSVKYRLQIGSRGEKTLALAYGCRAPGAPAEIASYTRTLALAEEQARDERSCPCTVESDDLEFTAWIKRSAADLGMLLTATPQGRVPTGGLPWLDGIFGRDAIFTALEVLWLWPDVARGVLFHLAARQSHDTFAATGAEPGKILNEARGGDVSPNYFGADTTPLFVMLAGAWFARTGDLTAIGELWPAIDNALMWIDTHGDLDGDGFVEARGRAGGVWHHGWRSSPDAQFHADGRIVEGPFALCEVQGYVYAAKLGAARIARALGDPGRALALTNAAEALRSRFNSAFWCADLDTFAPALDANKQACCVRTSTPGHSLYTGIAEDLRARQVISALGEEQCFSGWGVRTVAESELRFNPMSYHNGSVWPHDNAILAAGAARYDDKAFASRILTAQLDAAQRLPHMRLPELLCGFKRRGRDVPLEHPVACAPQATSAGAAFLLTQSVLGISIDAERSQIVLSHPVVPERMTEIRVKNLQVGEAVLDFTVRRHAGAVGVSVDRRLGKLDLVIRS
jgi:glycogen debranching enzyme